MPKPVTTWEDLLGDAAREWNAGVDELRARYGIPKDYDFDGKRVMLVSAQFMDMWNEAVDEAKKD